MKLWIAIAVTMLAVDGFGEEDAPHEREALPVEKRVAFMSGHVEAGLALYRAGAPEQASTPPSSRPSPKRSRQVNPPASWSPS